MLVPRCANHRLIGERQFAQSTTEQSLFSRYKPIEPSLRWFQKPACRQSEIGISSGPTGAAEVIRQINTSCRKSNNTDAGRALLSTPEVNGKRQRKISPNKNNQ